ncbi:hypothetical protein IFO70_10800 [Phormidium tenue FACHB-886]|nr:hypothetical protein [Phormidium tenue FACHB-886]
MAAVKNSRLQRRPIQDPLRGHIKEEQEATSAPAHRAVRRRERPLHAESRPIPLRSGKISQPTPSQADVVQALPRPQAPLPWLKALVLLQRTSSVLTFGLVVGLLVVYGWTVYTQQRWGQAFNRLEALQKQERQLMAANEVIKNQMAEQAEVPAVGLVLPEPGNTIFLTPAPQRPPVEPEINLPPPQPIPARPLGY